MGHHQIHVLILTSQRLRVLVGGSPSVEYVAEAGTGDLLKAGDTGLRQQFVAGDCIVDIRRNPQGFSKGPCHQSSQIGSVVKGGVMAQAVLQRVVHLIAPRHNMGE